MTVKERVLVYECISAGGLPASAGATAPPAPPGADLLAQGVAMRDAVATDLQRLEQVAVSCATARYAPLGAALAGVHAVHSDAACDPADFLTGQAQRYDRVWVIAPESDGLLATLAAAVGHGHGVGCAVSAIRLASSKAATRAVLAAHDIPVPASWHPGQAEPTLGTRWVVKPDDGAGCVATHLHTDFAQACADLQSRLARGMASTLERWIDGIPLSLSVLCTDGRAEVLSINRQRIVARPGQAVAYHGVDAGVIALDNADGRLLARLAQRIADAVPGLAGYVGVDLVWRAAAADGRRGGPVVIEINPRLTCSYVGLSAALGRNLAGEILRARHPESATDVAH